MQFTNPIWLWGLTGLLAPVLIHLLSRKEGKIIPIGSLRHLRESETARFSSIRLNELLLLLLRCLIIAAISLLLAEPKIGFKSKSKWLVLEPGLTGDKNLKALADSLTREGYETHFLSEGFPSDKPPGEPDANYWKLAEALSRKNVDAIVITNNFLSNYKGQRIPKPENIRWITTNYTGDSTYLVDAIARGTDSLWIRKAKRSAYEISLETDRQPNAGEHQLFQSEMHRNPIAVKIQDTINIHVVHSPEFGHESLILRSCLLALASAVPLKINISSSEKLTSQNYDWIIWLSRDQISALPGVKTIGLQLCPGKNLPIVISNGYAQGACPDPRTDWIITKRLTEANVIEENLTFKLASIIVPYPIEDPTKTPLTLPQELTWSDRLKEEPPSTIDKNANVNFAFVIIILSSILLERWYAFKKRQ